jgi:hypothetical protein
MTVMPLKLKLDINLTNKHYIKLSAICLFDISFVDLEIENSKLGDVLVICFCRLMTATIVSDILRTLSFLCYLAHRQSAIRLMA